MSQQSNTVEAGAQGTLERVRARRGDTSKSKKESPSFLETIRGTLDALVFAYLLAMFLRTYVFELYQIPTGSMTPTLIGDMAGDVVFYDYNEDGVDDVIYTRPGNPLQIFVMNEDGTHQALLFLDGVDRRRFAEAGVRSEARKDMIVVKKFAYWFSTPNRGDIAVFKVPDRPDQDFPGRSVFDSTKPVYIKRVAGLPGEYIEISPVQLIRVGFDNPMRLGTVFGGEEYHVASQPLSINGEPLDHPRVNQVDFFSKPTSPMPSPLDGINAIEVREDAVLLIGDNATSSKDGRYWGDVPLTHLRGRAIFRYYPFNAFGFLR